MLPLSHHWPAIARRKQPDVWWNNKPPDNPCRAAWQKDLQQQQHAPVAPLVALQFQGHQHHASWQCSICVATFCSLSGSSSASRPRLTAASFSSASWRSSCTLMERTWCSSTSLVMSISCPVRSACSSFPCRAWQWSSQTYLTAVAVAAADPDALLCQRALASSAEQQLVLVRLMHAAVARPVSISYPACSDCSRFSAGQASRA